MTHDTSSYKLAAQPARDIDCIVCGSCVADVLVRPVPLETPIGTGRLLATDPIAVAAGGIVSNASTALARLGMKAAALTYVGNDDWGVAVRTRLEREGVDCSRLSTHPTGSTSTTVVLIDENGERSFAHRVGAPKLIDRSFLLDNLDLFARSRMMLIGYYSLMPNLENDLPEVFAAIRSTGCRTAMDAAGSGGTMQPLERILPHLDVYVPSIDEAKRQTGLSAPRDILSLYRRCGAAGLVGVKLGSKGALLNTPGGQWIEIAAAQPPGPVIDTTGAGDSFFAGLIAGLLKGYDAADAGRLAAAVGACCVTGCGASAGLRNFAETAAIAGLPATAE